MLICRDLIIQKGAFSRPVPNIDVARGQSLAIVGPSGCGKTTLLLTVGGFLPPQSGLLRLGHDDYHALSAAKRYRWRAQNVGFIFANFRLIDSLNVRDNLILSQRASKQPLKDAYLDYLLNRLQIEELQKAMPYTLSTGQAQRVAIARALINRPSLVLADEPTSALDSTQAQNTISLLHALCAEERLCLVTVTHDTRIQAGFHQSLNLNAMS